MSDTQCTKDAARRSASAGSRIEATEEVRLHRVSKPYNKFDVWQGRDVWHQDRRIQVRLQDDGMVYVSTSSDDYRQPLQSMTIPFAHFYDMMRLMISENVKAHPTDAG